MDDRSEMSRRLSSLYDKIKKGKPCGLDPGQASAGAGSLRDENENQIASKKTSRGARFRNEIRGFEKIGDFTFHRQSVEKNPWQEQPPWTRLFTTGTTTEELVFFDTETTGLSGGAGTIIFLMGMARIRENMLFMDQYFLSDFPGENEFLSIIGKEFPDDAVYVSFNGKAFDSHLLYARFLMNGREKLLRRQYDLLFPCRRLWKHRLGSCCLKQVEAMVLGLPRESDIDGAEVPDRYFNFLRSGNPMGLEAVFHHNFLDVLSLAKLLALVESLYLVPPAGSVSNFVTPGFADPGAVAKMIFPVDPGRAEELLRIEFRKGNVNCGLILGNHYKRMRDHAGAMAVWEELYCQGKHPVAGIELAKLYEHRFRDIPKARLIVEELLANDETLSIDQEGLFIRKDRLDRKLARETM